MSDKTLSLRQRQILSFSKIGESYALSEIADLLSTGGAKTVSAPTLRRDVAKLCDAGFFRKSGERKSTRYSLDPKNIILAPIDAHDYCQLDIDNRPGSVHFNFDLFTGVPASFFTSIELSKLQQSSDLYLRSSIGASPTACRKELERFVIELSWKSSKIEGNTYTLLDTELLLREGIEADGHASEEALMILNHKKAFDYILQSTAEYLDPKVSNILDLHRFLVNDLNIQHGFRKRLIGITGSIYRPLPVPTQIEEACSELILALDRLKDPYSKALLMIAGISYIQPFEDGNKRTSRLSANAVLLASNCAPLSYRSISEISYREAILTFYEKNTILPLKELFIEQYIFACENYMRFK